MPGEDTFGRAFGRKSSDGLKARGGRHRLVDAGVARQQDSSSTDRRLFFVVVFRAACLE